MTWQLGRRARPVAALLLATSAVAALATSTGAALAQQVPTSPAPVAVTLDPSKTAIVILDVTTQTCSPQPTCVAMVPNIASLLANGRQAGTFVAYSTPAAAPPILPDVAPASGDPVFLAHGQDRFFSTDLDYLLRAHGDTTVVLAGWKEDGSIQYTSVGAILRGYTVVIADDGVSAPSDAEVAIGRYMMLNQSNANATNDALKQNAVTLSRSDLITFQ